jgi:hypothetical protein
MAIRMTRAHRDDMHDNLLAALGPLDPASVYIGVCKAFVDHGLDTVIADFTEGTGVGFARQKVVTWGAAHDLVDGTRASEGPMQTFKPSADTDAMEVVAWFAADALVAGNPLRWGVIAPPILLSSKATLMDLVVQIRTDPSGNHTSETIING